MSNATTVKLLFLAIFIVLLSFKSRTMSFHFISICYISPIDNQIFWIRVHKNNIWKVVSLLEHRIETLGIDLFHLFMI